MKKALSITFVCLLLIFGTYASTLGSPVHNVATKEGILLVAFGSSIETAQISFKTIEANVRKQYPDIPIRWAFTSHIIRNKLAKKGKLTDSTAMALTRMLDEKFTHVTVQSLHTIPGAEFTDLTETVRAFRQMKGFQSLVLGTPLLHTQEDIEAVSDAIFATIPKERSSSEAIVLVGHGTYHPANVFYPALMFQLQLRDPNLYVGTVEGYPAIDLILEMLLDKGITKAYLMPFMSVAGSHVLNDIGGKQVDSWKSVLEAVGIEVVLSLKGTAEHEAYAAIWVNHLKAAREKHQKAIH